MRIVEQEEYVALYVKKQELLMIATALSGLRREWVSDPQSRHFQVLMQTLEQVEQAMRECGILQSFSGDEATEGG